MAILRPGDCPSPLDSDRFPQKFIMNPERRIE